MTVIFPKMMTSTDCCQNKELLWKREKCESAEGDRKDDEEERLERVSDVRPEKLNMVDIKCNRKESERERVRSEICLTSCLAAEILK